MYVIMIPKLIYTCKHTHTYIITLTYYAGSNDEYTII